MFHSDYLFRRRISFSPLHPPQPSPSAAVRRRPPPSLPPATSRGALLRPKPTYFEAQRADLHAGGLPAGIRPPTRRHARVFSGSLAVHAPAREYACGRVAPSPVTRLHCQDRPAPSWCSSPSAVHSEHFFSTFCPFFRRRRFSSSSVASVGFSSSSVAFSTGSLQSKRGSISSSVDMATKNSIFTSVISGSPTITSEKLIGSENYLSWSASVELWFMGQGYEDHLITPEDDIPGVDKVQWKKIYAQLCSVLWQSVDPKILLHLRAYKTCSKFWNQAKALYTNDIQRLYKVASAIVNIRQQDMELSNYIGQIASLKEEFLTLMPLTSDVGAQQTQVDKFFMVLTLIGLRPDLETLRDQILGSPSVPSLDDVFARLLRISSTQTLPSDSPLDSSVLVSHTNLRGGRSGTRGRGQRPHCSYCNKLGHTRDRCYQLHGRPPRTAHVAQSSDSNSQSPQILSSCTSQGCSSH